MDKTEHQHRSIRSFVRREGRLTRAQSRALEQYWPEFGIDFSGELLDIDTLFGRRAPLVLDIGVGTGDSTLQHAMQHPGNNYLAIEVHRPGIGHLLNEMGNQHVTNIRVINHDVIPVLGQLLPAGSVSQVFIFFPDPWPKKRHQKRRLINAELLGMLQKILTRNGRLHIATDWEDYAEHIALLFGNSPAFCNLAGNAIYAPRPAWRVHTRYEARGTRLQHNVRDFCYCLD